MTTSPEDRPNHALAEAIDAALVRLPQHGRPQLARLLLRCGVPFPVIVRVLDAEGARRPAIPPP